VGCKKKASSATESSSSSGSGDDSGEGGLSPWTLSSYKSKDANNLKQMLLAMSNYNDAMGSFPPAATSDANGKPLLSWRVAILPYVEQSSLYNLFKHNEPWDSPANKALLSQMPKLYQSPGRSKDGDTVTYYRVFGALNPPTSPRAPFVLPVAGGGQPPPLRIANFTDGTTNTILIAEAEEGVPWTKPEVMIYNPKGPIPALSYYFNGVTQVGMGDGSVRQIKKSISEKTLRAAITMDGGEMLGPDF
jgi:hypothetical protein